MRAADELRAARADADAKAAQLTEVRFARTNTHTHTHTHICTPLLTESSFQYCMRRRALRAKPACVTRVPPCLAILMLQAQRAAATAARVAANEHATAEAKLNQQLNSKARQDKLLADLDQRVKAKQVRSLPCVKACQSTLQ